MLNQIILLFFSTVSSLFQFNGSSISNSNYYRSYNEIILDYKGVISFNKEGNDDEHSIYSIILWNYKEPDSAGGFHHSWVIDESDKNSAENYHRLLALYSSYSEFGSKSEVNFSFSIKLWTNNEQTRKYYARIISRPLLRP